MTDAAMVPAAHVSHPVSVNGRDDAWQIATEVPVQILVNGAPFTVMLATPADLEDLARGLLLTERIVDDTHAITRVTVAAWLGDVSVHVEVAEQTLGTRQMGARTLLGNSACGVCGVESLAQLQARAPQPPVERGPVPDDALLRALAALPARQPLHTLTHSVHAAAWCAPNGHILLVREDVGRHNALDKLVGALAASERLAEPGFILMSSRCSYELVYKAGRTGAWLLATVSAPTSMALQWASALDLPLAAALGRGAHQQVVRFPGLAPVHEGLP